MPGGSTTQFLFIPEARPNNRKYILALVAGFWTLCLGCTALSILVDIFTSGSALTILASPFIIAAAWIPNFIIASLIPRVQRYQRSHRYLLLGAFLAGAIIAIPPALLINTTLFLPAELSGAPLLTLLSYGTIPGIVEEGIKGAIVLFIFFRYRDEFHDSVDGIVIGALVGLGFAMTEDISSFLRGLGGGGIIGLALTLFMRLGLGWMNHSVFTACTGAGLGFARMSPRGSVRRWLLPIGGYVVAAGMHNTFDFLATLLQALLPGNLVGLLLTIVPLYGLTWTATAVIGFVVLRGWHHEADLVRDELRAEVATGVVTTAEYLALPNPAQRRVMLRDTEQRRSKPARRALGKLFQLEISLALQKRHTALGDPPGVPQLHSEDALRARIADQRTLLQGGAPAAPASGPPPLAPMYPPAPPPAPVHLPSAGGDSTRPAMPPPVAVPAGPRQYRLIRVTGEAPGAVLALRDGLTIGRNAQRAEVVLADPEVSGLHARVEQNGGPPVLIDAGSTNGTFVNDERITSRILQPGDRVRFGGVRFVVEAV
jgi:RsiW-degrading membrane proteinase PrsW (M82 family)